MTNTAWLRDCCSGFVNERREKGGSEKTACETARHMQKKMMSKKEMSDERVGTGED